MAARKKVARKASKSRKTAKKATRKRARKTSSAARRSSSSSGAGESSFPEIEALCELMDRHGLLEVDFKEKPDGSRKIRVSRVGPAAVAAAAPVVAHAAAPASEAAPGAAAPAAPAGDDEGLIPFSSPMVGTFYRAPSPEAPPFASVGDTIDPSSTVCIIEAMKVMNEIQSDVSGEIVSIEVENGEAVEFGQTLMLIRPR